MRTCTITVRFAPGNVTTVRTATLSIAHNAAGSPATVALSGQGQVAPPVMVTPATVAFGNRVVGTTRTVNVRVSNNGPGNLVFAANPLSLPAGPYTATMGNCPTTLAAGRSCNLSVSFRPTVVGLATGSLYGHQQCGRQSQDDHTDRHGTLTNRSEAVVDLHPGRDRLRPPALVTPSGLTDIPPGNRTGG